MSCLGFGLGLLVNAVQGFCILARGRVRVKFRFRFMANACVRLLGLWLLFG
jgi:hypothetical protein